MVYINKILIFSILCFSFQVLSAQEENFEDFLKKFSTDVDYQLDRTCFPLQKVYVNDDTFELDTVQIAKKDYKINKFYYELYDKTDAYPVIYNNFECKVDNSDQRVFRWKGFSDMDERYYFKRMDGNWHLVRIEILGI